MIDTNQLSALISAFRVETEKESISPETVGKLLQDIVDLLATASTDAERRKQLEALRQGVYGSDGFNVNKWDKSVVSSDLWRVRKPPIQAKCADF